MIKHSCGTSNIILQFKRFFRFSKLRRELMNPVSFNGDFSSFSNSPFSVFKDRELKLRKSRSTYFLSRKHMFLLVFVHICNRWKPILFQSAFITRGTRSSSPPSCHSHCPRLQSKYCSRISWRSFYETWINIFEERNDF